MNDVPERRELEPRLERLVTMVTQLREEDCLAELQKMLDQGWIPRSFWNASWRACAASARNSRRATISSPR